jgi:hypothetical protein
VRYVAFALILVLLAAGCGGDGSSSLSKDDFRSKADAICSKYERQIAKATTNVGAGPNQIAETIDKALPLIRKGQGELRDLKPPEDLAAKYDQWLDQGDDQVTEAEKLRDAARANDAKAFRSALAKLQTIEKSQDKIGRQDLGLKACAQSG